MYLEAAPFIEPDMSNYYRLLREKALRDRLATKYPDLAARFEALYQKPAVSSFLQAIPTRNINPREDFGEAVVTGAVPRGIDITNSIITRKLLVRRLTEACLNPQPDAAATAGIECEFREVAEIFGLPEDLAQPAIAETRAAAARLKTAGTLRLVPGGNL